jgi:hypothetical protein
LKRIKTINELINLGTDRVEKISEKELAMTAFKSKQHSNC